VPHSRPAAPSVGVRQTCRLARFFERLPGTALQCKRLRKLAGMMPATLAGMVGLGQGLSCPVAVPGQSVAHGGTFREVYLG